jgi:hypothetical protein
VPDSKPLLTNFLQNRQKTHNSCKIRQKRHFLGFEYASCYLPVNVFTGDTAAKWKAAAAAMESGSSEEGVGVRNPSRQ